MPRSAAAPILWWTPRAASMLRARRCVPSSAPLLQCPNGGDSLGECQLREIVLDTETTGLDSFQGHRMVEIGCIELVNRIPSGQTFHRYLNPERDMPPEALEVH